MTKIIQTDSESDMQVVISLANKLSLIESRYVLGESETETIAQYWKHTSSDLWWVVFEDVRGNMGDVGGYIMDILTGTVQTTGDPIINPQVMEIKEVDLILDGYLQA